MKTKTYQVTWKIEVDAANPTAAALEVLDCIINGSAKVFIVGEWGRPTPKVQIDLDDMAYRERVNLIIQG